MSFKKTLQEWNGFVLLLRLENNVNTYYGGSLVWLRATWRTLSEERFKEEENALDDSRMFVEKSK